jgi:TRAP-type uncharacterized transport system substrate-binding protein
VKIFRIAGALLLVTAIAALAYHYSRDWSTLRAAVPPLGPTGQKMLQDLARESVKEKTWLTLRRVPVDNASAAAAAIDKREADVALVRSDVAMPREGRTIAVFQTFYAFLMVPPRSTIEDFKGLKGRTIAIVPDNAADQELLDQILTQNGVSGATVYRQPMKAEDVGPAMQQRKIAAAFVVGPIGGVSGQTFASIQRAMKGTPTVLGVEEAEAVRRAANGVSATEVPKGVFGGSPAQPEEDLTTIGVTVRMVVPAKMSSIVAGELTRVLFEGKAKAAQSNPQMREMQQPDSDDKEYPIHPAAQAYFDGEAPTLTERVESIFWIGSAILGFIGTLAGWIFAKIKISKNPVAEHFNKMLVFLDEVRTADIRQLDDLQGRVDKAVRLLFDQRESGGISADSVAIYSLAIEYARNSINDRRAQLSSYHANG